MILLGLILMVGACGVAWFIGGAPERQGAFCLAACWIVSLIGQAILGAHSAIPLIVANSLDGLALLYLAYTHGKVWLWTTLTIQVVIIVLHAMWTEDVWYLSHNHAAVLNVLSFATLATLLIGAIRAAAQQRRSTPNTQTLGKCESAHGSARHLKPSCRLVIHR